MKKLRTMLSVILVIVLALAVSAPALAAGTIKIAEPKAGNTYSIYKVFEVTDDGAGNLTYTIPAASTDLADLLMVDKNADPIVSKFPGLSFTGTGPWVVNKVSGFNSANFASLMKANTAALTLVGTLDGTIDALIETTAAWVGDIAGDGYYLVVPSVGDKAALTTVIGNNVTVQDKNDMLFDKEIVDGSAEKKEDSVSVGDTVNFKINGIVPALDDDYTVCSYIVEDTMDHGLTFGGAVTVRIYNKTTTAWDVIPLAEITDESAILTGNQVRYGKNGHTFELSIDMLTYGKDAANYQGSAVEITYSATVNDSALSQVSENNAHLEYSDDQTTYTKDSQTKVYPVVIIVDKFETGAPEQKLSGAKFVLQRTSDDLYYQNTAGTIAWVAGIAAATEVTTDTNGAARFDGLEDGTYKLIETAAPAGYAIADPVNVTVNAAGVTDPTLNATEIAQMLTNYVHVADTPASILPSTGGRGATMLYAAGLILILGSGAFLLFRKRAEEP